MLELSVSRGVIELWRSGITTLNEDFSEGTGSGDETGRFKDFSVSG